MTKATTPEQFLASIEEPKRADLQALHDLIRRTVPDLAPGVAANMGTGMLGYGKFHYRYPSGTEGDTFRIALASNKTGISIYVNAVDERGYVAEQFASRLGKASVGKSCIRFKRLSDLDLPTLTAVVERAGQLRGAGEAEAGAAPAAPAAPAKKPSGKKTSGKKASGKKASKPSSKKKPAAGKKPTAGKKAAKKSKK